MSCESARELKLHRMLLMVKGGDDGSCILSLTLCSSVCGTSLQTRKKLRRIEFSPLTKLLSGISNVAVDKMHTLL